MTGKIQIIEPDINDNALDQRGAIFSFIPHDAIVEWCYIYTKPNNTRGHHYHKEFDEYIMLVEGEGVYFELLENNQKRKIVVGPGTTIYVPKKTPHTFFPLTECKSVSFLTKKWNDCKEPITKVDKV
jgi:mannose-6-phosphate isomerase-like protein (cupin superfamily)